MINPEVSNVDDNGSAKSPGKTLAPRLVQLTPRSGVEVRRTLPHKEVRMIGAWCFVDHFGPTDQQDAMSVAAHPHTGLQTASWLFSGEVEHHDSVGSSQVVRPGQLNLMTAGRGIAHSELSSDSRGDLHGVQLWIALPDEARHVEPFFEHHAELPVVHLGGSRATVFVGQMFGVTASATVFTSLVGADLALISGCKITVSTQADFEYGFLVAQGNVRVNVTSVPEGSLHYVQTGHTEIELSSDDGARVVLLGGRPFEEPILMWWNFIGRTHDEIVTMRNEWESASNVYPAFNDAIGGRIPAPQMPHVRLHARGNSR